MLKFCFKLPLEISQKPDGVGRKILNPKINQVVRKLKAQRIAFEFIGEGERVVIVHRCNCEKCR